MYSSNISFEGAKTMSIAIEAMLGQCSELVPVVMVVSMSMLPQQKVFEVSVVQSSSPIDMGYKEPFNWDTMGNGRNIRTAGYRYQMWS